MATGSPLIKVIMLYFAINLLLYAGGIRTFGESGGINMFTTATNNTSTFYDNTQQYGVYGTGISTPFSGNGTVNVNEQTTNGTTLSFIDVLRAVRDFINFLGVLFGGIFILFLYFPPAVQLFVGVPLGLLAIIAAVYFTRSGQ